MQRLLLALLLGLPLTGCDKNKATEPVVDTDATIAASLWQTMSNEQYTVPGATWGLFPLKAGIYAPDATLLGADPHVGPTHFRTFANATARTALTSSAFPLPENSIIANQNFVVAGPDTTLAAITVMFKKAGYDAEHGDWFWAKFKPDGQAETAGKVTMCIGCHQGASAKYGFERDYVWTRTPDPPFDSGLHGAGFSYLRSFHAEGEVPYYCIPHAPDMRGTVTVSASSSTDSAVVVVGPGANVFSPAAVTVKLDGRVRWTWAQGVHTVTSGTPAVPATRQPMAGDQGRRALPAHGGH